MTNLAYDEPRPYADYADEEPLTNVQGLTRYLRTENRQPRTLTLDDYEALSKAARFQYDEQRLDYLGGNLTVLTPTVTRARQLVGTYVRNNRRKHGTQRPGIIISGDGTSGKTTTCQAMMHAVYDRARDRYPYMDHENRRPVAFIEIPSECNPKLFWVELAKFYGVKLEGKPTQDTVRVQVLDAIRAARTDLIVIDELQNLSAGDIGTKKALQAVRQLTSDFLGIVVVAGVNLRDDKLFEGGAGRQLGGRMTEIDLEPFGIATPLARKEWRGLISAFERQMPLISHQMGTLSEHWQRLHEITGGSISTLSKVFISSANALIYDENPAAETMTLDLILSQPRDKASMDIDTSQIRAA